MPPVTTGQIYWGAVPFVLIQCVMVALLIAAPGLVRHDTVPVPRAAPAHYAPGAPQKAQGQGLSLPPYPPAIPGAPPPLSSGPGAPTLDLSVPPTIAPRP